MDIIKLTARTRTGTGKSYTRKIRNKGWIPAVYYGHNKETKHIEIDAKEFLAIVRAKNTTHLIDLGLSEKEEDAISIIKEIQKHVLLNNLYFHVDFQSVSMDKKITVDCPIVLRGTAIGVKEDNGILNHPVRSVTIECLPGDIPDHIDVDVSNLHLGKSIHVKDISVENIIIKDSPEEVVAVIVAPQVGTEAVDESEEEGEEGKKEDSKEEDGKEEDKGQKPGQKSKDK